MVRESDWAGVKSESPSQHPLPKQRPGFHQVSPQRDTPAALHHLRTMPRERQHKARRREARGGCADFLKLSSNLHSGDSSRRAHAAFVSSRHVVTGLDVQRSQEHLPH